MSASLPLLKIRETGELRFFIFADTDEYDKTRTGVTFVVDRLDRVVRIEIYDIVGGVVSWGSNGASSARTWERDNTAEENSLNKHYVAHFTGGSMSAEQVDSFALRVLNRLDTGLRMQADAFRRSKREFRFPVTEYTSKLRPLKLKYESSIVDEEMAAEKREYRRDFRSAEPGRNFFTERAHGKGRSF